MINWNIQKNNLENYWAKWDLFEKKKIINLNKLWDMSSWSIKKMDGFITNEWKDFIFT